MRVCGGKVLAHTAAICSTCSSLVGAITMDISSDDSIKTAASDVAYDMMKYYTGNHTGDVAGNLPDPYYWWEAGAMFGIMVDYWYYTGDTTYNAEVKEALLHQAGDDFDFMPTNQTKTEGNDDQGFWGMAAMTAAEANFDNPDSGTPGWLAMAQAVFNDMASRWDDSTCGGGLRWQIFTFNSGYDYKNSIANGCFFNLGARLAAYTGNSSYADWAEKVYDWQTSIGLIGDGYEVYDGSSDTTNCSTIDHVQWTYNAGIYLFGSAMMYNYTNGSSIWETRTTGLLNATSVFFKDDVMFEAACENTSVGCDTDEQTFKAYLSRWMAATSKSAPFTESTIMTYINASAQAAAKQCDGGASGRACGEHWTAGSTYDGKYGVGEQMSALSIIQATLIGTAANLVTMNTGGTSVGNAAGGSGSSTNSDGTVDTPVTSGDKAGAGFLTAVMVVGVLGGVGFMVMG
ncbi:glycoside hydrolase family 76 protein [Sclerotinia borealis F-4128]|uniref:Mannan endo-1,6-alpha-mannosidase n=1 Tax=Sclerotinia borealis (strain F-4128) TaxID=1432307 RepID=W9C9K0_SCLBF|nr:glycoside hydrolase family 76 protein [Sclerotinia borealis F-4128]